MTSVRWVRPGGPLSDLTGGDPPLTPGAEIRGEGGVAGMGPVSQEVLGFGSAVGRRFWNRLWSRFCGTQWASG